MKWWQQAALLACLLACLLRFTAMARLTVLSAGEAVIVATGKFGPYIRCGALSRAVPKVGRWLALLAGLLGCLMSALPLLLCQSRLLAALAYC